MIDAATNGGTKAKDWEYEQEVRLVIPKPSPMYAAFTPQQAKQTKETWECDFVICDGRDAKLAVQVSYDISSAKTKEREIAGLLVLDQRVQL